MVVQHDSRTMGGSAAEVRDARKVFERATTSDLLWERNGSAKAPSLNEEHKEDDQGSKKDGSSNRCPPQKFTGSQNLFSASHAVMPFIEPDRAFRLRQSQDV